jgi:hypothetical protein
MKSLTRLAITALALAPIAGFAQTHATMAPAAISMTGNAVPLSIQNPYLGIFPSRN